MPYALAPALSIIQHIDFQTFELQILLSPPNWSWNFFWRLVNGTSRIALQAHLTHNRRCTNLWFQFDFISSVLSCLISSSSFCYKFAFLCRLCVHIILRDLRSWIGYWSYSKSSQNQWNWKLTLFLIFCCNFCLILIFQCGHYINCCRCSYFLCSLFYQMATRKAPLSLDFTGKTWFCHSRKSASFLVDFWFRPGRINFSKSKSFSSLC